MDREEQAADAQAIINAELEKLGWNPLPSQVADVLENHMPPGWDWVDATCVGGPKQIVLTTYTPPHLR